MELEDRGLSLGPSTYLLATAKFTAVRWEVLLVPPTSLDSCEDEITCDSQTLAACRASYTLQITREMGCLRVKMRGSAARCLSLNPSSATNQLCDLR